MRPSRLLFVAVYALLILIWGTTWGAIRINLQGIPPFTGVAARFAISSLLLLAAAPFLGVRFGRTAVERRLWIANALLSFCGSYGIVYWAEQTVPSGLASVLFATFPLFVALFAHFGIPGERLTPKGLAGVVLGFLGVAVIFSEDLERLGGPGVATASAVMLASPIVSALSNVAIKKWGQDVHPVSLSAVPMGIAAAVMGAVAFTTERHAVLEPTPAAVAALVYLAVFGSAVTFSLYYWLLRHLPATQMALVAYLIPVVAVAVGAVWLDEPVTARTLAGSALVVFGVAAAVRKRGEPS